MTVSPFEHPLLSGLLGDAEVASCFSPDAEIAAMLAFEAALARAEGAASVIPSEAAETIARAIEAFRPDMDDLRAGVGRDGLAVPALVRQLRAAVGGENAAHVHFGSTSQDVIDTGLALRLKGLLEIFATRLDRLDTQLAALAQRDGAVDTMAHTRMQAAIPVTAARKIASWRDPLTRHRARLDVVQADIAVLSFGGAAGTLDKLGDKAGEVRAALASALGLGAPERPRHSERDAQAALADWLSLVTGSLGKMGQDIALMAQTETGEIRLSSGGGSSAMPHKVNPVGAETMVALARFNATLVSGMHHALVHENERSGAAWTLEWMLLPQMAAATGAALNIGSALVETIGFTPSSRS